jgi:protocatechuate 3,4-dioxygenase beta subunit
LRYSEAVERGGDRKEERRKVTELSATPSQIEGPYFTPGSPERTSLIEPGTRGTRVTLTGRVLSQDGEPVVGALLDFWQCDADGVYDLYGYKLRGHQFADYAGRYLLETIDPGVYTGRTRHIHVKVKAPGYSVITSQLYFPGEPLNDEDEIYSPEVVMDVEQTADGLAATFDFVLDLSNKPRPGPVE